MTDASNERPAPLAVGDTVFIEWHLHGNRRSGNNDLVASNIERIGHKWITIKNNYRFKKGETKLDGGIYFESGDSMVLTRGI